MANRIDPERLSQELVRPQGPWREVSCLATTGSTNADLAAAARAGAESGLVLVAEHQSAGRGRFDRVWTAPARTSLAISVLLRPDSPVQRWSWLPLLAGLAVGEALSDLTGLSVDLKWPNDVLIGTGKVCGILAERVEGNAVVIGFGINTTATPAQLPSAGATSLALAGASFDETEVVAGCVSALGRRYLRWLDGEDLRSDYVRRCASLGRQVRVQLGSDQQVIGEAVDVNEQGCLVVRSDGVETAFAAGDVIHLR